MAREAHQEAHAACSEDSPATTTDEGVSGSRCMQAASCMSSFASLMYLWRRRRRRARAVCSRKGGAMRDGLEERRGETA